VEWRTQQVCHLLNNNAMLLIACLVYTGISTADTHTSDNIKSASDAYMEDAAGHFENFVREMWVVMREKLDDAAKRGPIRAILLPNTDSREDEEKMAESLRKGVKNLGDGIAADTAEWQATRKKGGKR